MAAAALTAASAIGVSPRYVSVPHASASAAQTAQAAKLGHVVPLYSSAPAPIGLSDLGLSQGSNGAIVPSILNTTSVRGEFDPTATGLHASYLTDSSPDGYNVQLNAVLTNIHLFGKGGYSFWTQNWMQYFPASDEFFFLTNIWNFSGGPLSSNVFYQHGPLGTQVGTTFYYALDGPFKVTYPFDLTYYLNSTVVHGRNAMYFSSELASPSGRINLPNWDFAIFNSTTAHGKPVTVPSNYTANGYHYDPIGLTDDFEIDVGGPGGGSQVDFLQAAAHLGLSYWDAGAHGYRVVPSAWGIGSETGETAIGASMSWSDAPGGPADLPAWGLMSTGPSMVRGLWNAGTPEGAVALTIPITPSNAFVFVSPPSNALTDVLPYWAPTVDGSTLWLSPGTYRLEILLSNFDPAYATVTLVAGHAKSYGFTLHADASRGIYTPLWAWQNAQIPAIAQGGHGTAWSPYVLVNDQSRDLWPLFGLYNDYSFPVFPGVYLIGTSVYTELANAPSFQVRLPVAYGFPYTGLPATNDLPYWFIGVSHVAIVHSEHISGWYSEYVYGPALWDTFDVVFYQSTGNLIAGNEFFTQSQGILLFSGGHNTVWGNKLYQIAPPNSAADEPLLSYGQGLGIEIAEYNDLVYNNFVNTPTTAWQLIINLYTGAPARYNTHWNIPRESASIVHRDAYFPSVALSGSILGTSWQGGNFWWDYGVTLNPYNGADNPYHVLPYTENATTPTGNSPYIYPGGDYAPLTP